MAIWEQKVIFDFMLRDDGDQITPAAIWGIDSVRVSLPKDQVLSKLMVYDLVSIFAHQPWLFQNIGKVVLTWVWPNTSDFKKNQNLKTCGTPKWPKAASPSISIDYLPYTHLMKSMTPRPIRSVELITLCGVGSPYLLAAISNWVIEVVMSSILVPSGIRLVTSYFNRLLEISLIQLFTKFPSLLAKGSCPMIPIGFWSDFDPSPLLLSDGVLETV